MKVMVIKNIVFLGNVNVMFIKLIIVVYIYIICIINGNKFMINFFFIWKDFFFFFNWKSWMIYCDKVFDEGCEVKFCWEFLFFF